MERRCILRLLRIAFSAVCGIICLLLIVLWVRSYTYHDGIWGRASQPEGFHASSHEGRLQLNTIRNLGIIEWRLVLGERIDVVRTAEYIPRFEYSQSALGMFLAIPIWLPVALLGLFTGTLANKTRFSLRSLLVATTLVAVVLGLVVAFR